MTILSDKEILEMAHDGVFLQSIYEITRDIESLVIAKIKAQGGVVRRITTSLWITNPDAGTSNNLSPWGTGTQIQ